MANPRKRHRHARAQDFFPDIYPRPRRIRQPGDTGSTTATGSDTDEEPDSDAECPETPGCYAGVRMPPLIKQEPVSPEPMPVVKPDPYAAVPDAAAAARKAEDDDDVYIHYKIKRSVHHKASSRVTTSR